MDQRPSTGDDIRGERIRHLGFNPEQLTPHEQVELLELHTYLASRSFEEESARGRPDGESEQFMRAR
jgi:hypothetical protein